MGPSSADVGRLNEALVDHIGETEALRFIALPVGTAVAAPPALLRAMRDGGTVREELLPWTDFLRRSRV